MSEDRQASPANRAEETVQAIAFGDDSVLYKVVPANAENATLTCHVKLLELLFVRLQSTFQHHAAEQRPQGCCIIVVLWPDSISADAKHW